MALGPMSTPRRSVAAPPRTPRSRAPRGRAGRTSAPQPSAGGRGRSRGGRGGRGGGRRRGPGAAVGGAPDGVDPPEVHVGLVVGEHPLVALGPGRAGGRLGGGESSLGVGV